MSVDFKHPDYKKNIDKWNLVNDVCDAENLQKYLIKRNPEDISTRNSNRNNQIFKRAIFSAIAGYTSRGFVGQIFDKNPVINLTPPLNYLITDCTGSGVSIYQQAQDTCKDIVRIGRSGLLVDMPISTGKEASKADIDNGRVFSTIIKYNADQILNWQTIKIGAKVQLSLVVLSTHEDKILSDGFSFESNPIRLELRLLQDDAGVYYAIQKWIHDENNDEWIPQGFTIPLDGNQQRWNEIPFIFIGAESNTVLVDQPPMYDIAKVNIGHYNNSAIYEDSVFIVGQAQPWMSGVTADHLQMLSENNMYVGSGQMLGVPTGEKFGIEQVNANNMSYEAMKDKIDQMIGLGAMFLQPGSAVKTATQSKGEQRVQHSVLSLIAKNVSEAYSNAIEYAAKFMGSDVADVPFELNDDFIDPEVDAQTITAMTSKFIQGAIPINDYLVWEQKHGFVDPNKTIEDYTEELNPASDNY